MLASVFDLFKLGVGPSSSHTMGPMTAAGLFVRRLRDGGRIGAVARVETTLFGSLALTGAVVTVDAMHCQKKHSSKPPPPAFI